MIKYSEAVAKALGDKSPIVALESTIITHGLPRPKNLEVALEVEQIVIEAGATPATIAIIDGQINIGLEPDQLTRIANDENILKASIRDLAVISTQKKKRRYNSCCHITYCQYGWYLPFCYRRFRRSPS